MPQGRLLHVVHLPLNTPQQIAASLRVHRLRFERCPETDALLFLCDLPDADAKSLPGDADLIRCVQSGVMSMNARRPGKYLFLVRSREKSPALSLWLGAHQDTLPRAVLQALLTGKPSAPVEASNISAGSLIGRFDAVLIVHASLNTLPDTPARMLRQLRQSGASSLCAQVCIPRRDGEILLVRLLREGFTMIPPFASAVAADEPSAAIYAVSALSGPPPAQAASDCVFFLDHPPTVNDLFYHTAIRYARHKNALLLPLVQLFLLLLSAFLGWETLALSTLLVPELRSLLRPRLLPGALIRLAFLPRLAMAALNTLLCRRFFKKEYQLLAVCDSGVCPFLGAVLLFLAVRSISALAVLFFVGLLWLAAPVMERSLSMPARERIPLDNAEQLQLRRLTEAAFLSLAPDAASPSHLLAACAGCMMGLLEPDEAARRAERMLARLCPRSAFDAACMLASAQYFTEHMAQCDAALRALPRNIEARVRLLQEDRRHGPLSALIWGALKEQRTEEGLAAFSAPDAGDEMDALFLPRDRIAPVPSLLPLTHPHTFLKQLRTLPGHAKKGDPSSPVEEANRFLILACSALGAPFHALFLRSARIAPYAPLLDLA